MRSWLLTCPMTAGVMVARDSLVVTDCTDGPPPLQGTRTD
jgi:hypothetical protein